MASRDNTRVFLAWAVAGAALAVGAAGAARPVMLVALPLLAVVVGLLVVAPRSLEPGIAAWVFLVLVAATKFRHRDATASLSGEADNQVILELGLYALLAVALVVIWWSRRVRLRPVGRMERVLLLYVVVAAASSFWSAAPLLTLCRSLQLGTLALAALLFVRLLTPDRVLLSMSTPLTLYVVASASLALLFPAAAGGMVEDGVSRFSWFAVHPISAGTLAGIAALGLCLRLLAGERNRPGHPRLWLWLLITALIGIAVLTRSRGPLIAFAGALTFGFLLRRTSAAASALLASAMLVAAILIGNSDTPLLELLSNWSAHPGALGSLLFRGQGADAVVGFSGRLRLWSEAIPLFLEQPWLGSGFQGSRAELLDLASWSGHAHNGVLQSLLDLGLLGSILLFSAFASIFVVGPLRSPVIPPRVRFTRLMVLALGMFEILNAVSNPSFAGVPGYETLIVFTCICLAQRLRHTSASRQSLGPTPAGSLADVRRAAPQADADVGASLAPSTSG